MQILLKDANGLWRENVRGKLIIVGHDTNLEKIYLLLGRGLQIDEFVYMLMWHENKPLRSLSIVNALTMRT